MKLFLGLCLALSCLFLGTFGVRAMTSTNYSITWDSVNSGGDDSGTSANYRVQDTIGQPIAGVSTSSLYSLASGYRADTDPFALSFVLYGQDRSRNVAYTSFDDIANQVTVATTTEFTLGGYIVVIENEGLGQMFALGRVTSIVGNVLTVDGWSGGDSSLLSSVPSGGDDFVAPLGPTSGFGEVQPNQGYVTFNFGSVLVSASSGYAIYFQADDSLRNGTGGVIEDVADGSVSGDAEEYGMALYGDDVPVDLDGLDIPVPTTTQRLIAQRDSRTMDGESFVALLKLMVTPTTPSGSYGQTLFFTLTANY